MERIKRNGRYPWVMVICMLAVPTILMFLSLRSGETTGIANFLHFVLHKPHLAALIILGLALLMTWSLVCWAFYRAVGWFGWRYNLIPLPLGIKEVYRQKKQVKDTSVMRLLRKFVHPGNDLVH